MIDEFILELKREGLTFRKHVQGILRIRKVWDTGKECREDNLGSFLTMERGVRYVNLKIGTYEMKHSIKNTHRRVKCLRPTDRRLSTILIHDALNDDPRNITGCIAPFPFGGESCGQSSAEAMELLWTMLGGWHEGKKVTLKVLTNVPGETRTKETWGRLR
ncbi:MAG: hypothetical protein R2747_12440 [Pyrinomonadaceae bacterium]